MKKDIIVVPKEKCPLDVLSEMGRKVRNAWIFLHESVINKFEAEQNQEVVHLDDGTISYKWNETPDFPETILEISNLNVLGKVWYPVVFINACDIAFEKPSDDPKHIYFFQMEK